jgi:hypothetical protein
MKTTTLIRPDPPTRPATAGEPAGLTHRRDPARPAGRGVVRMPRARTGRAGTAGHRAQLAATDRPAITIPQGVAVYAGPTGVDRRHRACPAVADG